MTVVQEGPPTVLGTSAPPDPTNADLLFKEAKVVNEVGAWPGSAWSSSWSAEWWQPLRRSVPVRSLPRTLPRSRLRSRPKSTGVPIGSIVSLKRAGPLAVGPTGALYVSDPTRHQVLVRLANGQFRVVAGDGKAGFTGDGGPATRAELSDLNAMAFAPNGDLYLADGSRVRAVNREGMIRTIAGNGHSDSVPDGTPALSAPLGQVASIAFSPNGELYIATSHLVSSQLFRLTATGQLASVQAILRPGTVQMPGALDSFGSIAVDGEGNIYASSSFDGWSVFKISPDAVATYLGYARRSGGTTTIVQRGPGGVIEVDDGQNILRAEGNQLVTSLAVNTVPGINTFTFTDFFALAPDGTLYADNLGPPGFEPFQQIVSVTEGRGVSLWRGAPAGDVCGPCESRSRHLGIKRAFSDFATGPPSSQRVLFPQIRRGECDEARDEA